MSPIDSAPDLKLSPGTIAVHGGERTDEQEFGAVVSPVFHSATFAFKDFDEMRRYAHGELPDAYFYSRYANPTVAEAERKIAELEGAEACVVTSSGSAATFCTMATLCASGSLRRPSRKFSFATETRHGWSASSVRARPRCLLVSDT